MILTPWLKHLSNLDDFARFEVNDHMYRAYQCIVFPVAGVNPANPSQENITYEYYMYDTKYHRIYTNRCLEKTMEEIDNKLLEFGHKLLTDDQYKRLQILI